MAILAHHARGPLISSLVVRIITFPGLLTSYSPVAWSNLLSTLRYVDTWTLHHGSLNYISRSLLVLICIVVVTVPSVSRLSSSPFNTTNTLPRASTIAYIIHHWHLRRGICLPLPSHIFYLAVNSSLRSYTTRIRAHALNTTFLEEILSSGGHYDFFVMFEYVSSFSSRSLAANLIVCTCTQPTC